MHHFLAISEFTQIGVTVWKCSIWVKIGDFFCGMWPSILMGDLEKQYPCLLYTDINWSAWEIKHTHCSDKIYKYDLHTCGCHLGLPGRKLGLRRFFIEKFVAISTQNTIISMFVCIKGHPNSSCNMQGHGCLQCFQGSGYVHPYLCLAVLWDPRA